MGKAFDIAEVFGNVPDSGTKLVESIELIDIANIDPNPNNFYELSGIDALANNIALCGLMDPLRVRDSKGGHVMIISGHRRRAAIKKLVDEGNDQFRMVPCIREATEADGVSADMQELRLIYANSDTRRMSNGDMMRQADRVQDLLYSLKEKGVEFPGRMRDYVADACKISKTKLANIKVIKANLIPDFLLYYKKGDIGESTALELARLPEAYQKQCFKHAENKSQIRYYYESDAKRDGGFAAALDTLKCKQDGGAHCENADRKWDKICAESYYYGDCHKKCCSKCENLGSCKYACEKLADNIKKIKADKKEAKRQEKLAQEAKDEPVIRRIQDLWYRFGFARQQAKKSVEQACEAMAVFHGSGTTKKYTEMEDLTATVTPTTDLPYGYRYNLDCIKYMIAIADLFGCSIDYLFCRTDVPEMAVKSEQPEWRTGQIPCEGYYVCKLIVDPDGDPLVMRKIAYSYGVGDDLYFSRSGAKIASKCIGWLPLPYDSDVDVSM